MKDVFAPQSNAPIGKISRKFGKDTKTWKIFEALFLDPSIQYPYTIHPVPRGEAINLAIGLNCCNRQWAEEQGLPREFIQFSAKALRGASPASWSLEISTNHRQQRTSTSSSWMDKYLSAGNDTASSPVPGELGQALVYVPSGTEAPGTVSPEPEISHMESALENWLSGEKPSTDEANAASGRYPLSTEGEE